MTSSKVCPSIQQYYVPRRTGAEAIHTFSENQVGNGIIPVGTEFPTHHSQAKQTSSSQASMSEVAAPKLV
jgi:hypothetical protein